MCSPLRKDEKSKCVLGGGPALYKTMDSIENLTLHTVSTLTTSDKLFLLVVMEPCDVTKMVVMHAVALEWWACLQK